VQTQLNGKQATISTGTVDQTINGTLALTSWVNCTATGGVLQYSTATHLFTCHTLASADIPNNAANTSGTAGNLSGTPALPNGTTATTQSQADASAKLATTAYVDTGLGGKAASNAATTVNGQTCTLGSSCTIPLSAINPQTATYQVLTSDFSAYKTITVASGTFTITLVASGSQPANGQSIYVVNYGSGVVTIARSGQNINGGTASLTLAAGSAATPTWAKVWSDGNNYFATGPAAAAAGGTTWNAPASITSLPSCTSSIYFQPFNDALYNYGYCDGSSNFTTYLQGQKVTPPAGTFAWTNQGSAAVTKQTNGIWSFDIPQHGGGESMNVYDTATPAAPFTKVFHVSYMTSTSNGHLGVSMRESGTGKILTASLNVSANGVCTINPCFAVLSYTNTTTFSSALAAGAVVAPGTTLAIKVSVASGSTGNITISISYDNGLTYQQLYQAAKNAFFTTAPDNIGIYGNNVASGAKDYFLTLLGID
jgi:hypothetical protein